MDMRHLQHTFGDLPVGATFWFTSRTRTTRGATFRREPDRAYVKASERQYRDVDDPEGRFLYQIGRASAGVRVTPPSGNRAASRKRTTPRAERTAYFAISTYTQDVVEANAEDTFGPRGEPDGRRTAMADGLVDEAGAITPQGWEVLNQDVMKLERNSLAWLRKKFVFARDDGHDSRGDLLVGTVWYDAGSRAQRELIDLGESERVDMNDPTYGDLSRTVWDDPADVSWFGELVLGGGINFQKDERS